MEQDTAQAQGSHNKSNFFVFKISNRRDFNLNDKSWVVIIINYSRDYTVVNGV